MSPVTQSDLLLALLPSLRSYVRRAVRSQEPASDLLQEVCVRVLAGQGPDDPERFVGWCYGIARHVVAHHYRVSRRARDDVPFAEDLCDADHARAFDAEARVDARVWMLRALKDLDGDGLVLLLRRYLLDESGKELADELEQSSASVRMRLKRLRCTVVSRSVAGAAPRG